VAIAGSTTTTIVAAKENCACCICCVAHFISLSIRCTKIIKKRFKNQPEVLKTSEKSSGQPYEC